MLAVAAFFWLCSVLVSWGQKNPTVVIKTTKGDIEVLLYADKAPVTVSNFLRYVDSAMYDGSGFYRVVTLMNQPNDSVKIEVIQGGRRDLKSGGFPPIPHEHTGITGILHRDGVISMARSKPGTATSEFFICVGDQPALDFGGKRNPDGQGFASFGIVTSGMNVVKEIQAIPAATQYPGEPVRIVSVSRK